VWKTFINRIAIPPLGLLKSLVTLWITTRCVHQSTLLGRMRKKEREEVPWISSAILWFYPLHSPSFSEGTV
jgi:hypothetical protein